MSRYLAQKHSTIQIVRIAGALIADGQGTYRPRLKADDFAGRIVIQGSAYRVRLRWPNGAEAHEIDADIRPLGETDDSDSVALGSVMGF